TWSFAPDESASIAQLHNARSGASHNTYRIDEVAPMTLERELRSMHTLWRSLFVLVALLIAGTAWAQEQTQGWFGVDAQNVTKEEADKLGWESPRGVKVVRTRVGSPAAAAGLEPGDVIETVDGVEVADGDGLKTALIAKGGGAVVKLRLLRA